MKHKNRILKILHLEDLAIDVELIDRELKKSGLHFETFVAIDEKSFRRGLTEFVPDIILSDHSLPSIDSLGALKVLRERQIGIPFILVTSTTFEEVAVNAMKEGAWDFIVKDRFQRLPLAISQAMEKYNFQQTNHQVEIKLAAADRKLSFHIENTPFAFIEWDDKLNVKSWSKRAEEIFGWTEKEVMEGRAAAFANVYDEDKAQAFEFAEALTSGSLERTMIVHRHCARDGRIIWCEWHSSVQKDEAGKVTTLLTLVKDVTARKKNEEDLKYSEVRLREFFESAPMAVTVTDAVSGKFIDVNENFLKLLGYTAEKLSALSLSDLSPPIQPCGRPSYEMAAEFITATMNGEKPIFEWLSRDSKGKDFLCEVRLNKLTGQGINNEILACMTDITERKRDEEFLREVNQRYENLSKATNDAVWDWDIVNDKEIWNHGITTIFGYAEREIKATVTWWKNKIHPDDYDRINSELKEAFKNKRKNWVSRYQYLCENGTYKNVLDRAYILYKDEQPIRMIGAMQDITEVMQYRLGLEKMVSERTHDLEGANAHLQVSNKGLQAANKELSALNVQVMLAEIQLQNTANEIKDLYNTAACGYLSLNSTGLFVDMNDTLLGWLGYSREELVNMLHISDTLADEGREKFKENFPLLIKHGTITDIEACFVRKDGTSFPTMINSSSICDDSGNFIKSRTSVFDTTKIKKIENELKVARSVAESANLTKRNFLANMSHEIRTPLNAVLGLSHLALKTEMTPKQSDYLKKIQSSSESLLSIINDILDFSKVESGNVKLEEVTFDLEEVFQKLSDVITYKAEAKGLEIAFGIDGTVPSYLIGDPACLERILSNLCSNAVKFTHKGEVVIKVRCAETSGERIKLEFNVSDTGIGMDETQLGGLFKPFTQADNSISRKYGGTGLGLSILKHLVELMEGEVSVKSTPGEGSDFRFTVWLKAQKHQRKIAAPSIDLRKLNVMIVEDNQSALKIFKEMLESFSFNVIAVDSGLKALHFLKNNFHYCPIQLVLLDNAMPCMDGLEVASVIRADEQLKGIKIIMVCRSNRYENLYQRAEELDLSGILIKPIRYSTAYDAIISAIENNEKFKHKTGYNIIHNPEVQKFHQGHILLVEDNEINQQVASELLIGFGFTVDIAENGLEGVKKIQDAVDPVKYDLVLMDLQMPLMGGLKATMEIRKNDAFKDLPIVAMTADAIVGVKQKCLEAGMMDFISKPINPELMLITIEKWLKPLAVDSPAMNPVANTVRQKVWFPAQGIEGIDQVDGLHHVSGNTSLYHNLLFKFIVNYEHFIPDWKRKSGSDHDEGRRMLHTLKAVSGNLGMVSLHEKCVRSEEFLTQESVSLEEIMQDLSEEISTIIAALRKNMTVEMIPTTLNEITHVKHHLDELALLLRENDPEAVNVLKQIGTIKGFENQVDEIGKSLLKYDFAAALQTLSSIHPEGRAHHEIIGSVEHGDWKKLDVEIFWGEIAPCDHVLQIYEDERTFLDLLAGFAIAGIKAGDCVIVIATASHINELENRLKEAGYDPFRLRLMDQYIPLDANEALNFFMENGLPDGVLFRHMVTSLVSRAKSKRRKVRAFGEMVAVLWARNNKAATIQLEDLWNTLGRTESFSLFCAYPRVGFTETANDSIQNICGAHAKMVTGFTDSPNQIFYKNLDNVITT